MSSSTLEARYLDGYFTNKRRQQLFYCTVFPPQSVPVRGIIQFQHGLGEHALRFRHVYDHFVAQGFGVLAHDLIAHGRSDSDQPGLRGHADAFEHFVDDSNAFLTMAKFTLFPRLLDVQKSDNACSTTWQHPPLVFMGISLGALVGLHTILSGKHKFAAAVLASPALGVEVTTLLKIQGLLSKPLSWAIPTAKIVPAVNFNGTSRCLSLSCHLLI